MSDSASSGTIETVLSEMRSRLLTEQCELLFGSELGVMLKAARSSVRFFTRSVPVRQLPPDAKLFGRDVVVRRILTALQAGQNLEIYGVPGIGKTALLRSVLHQPELQIQPDGILYLERSSSIVDLLQVIFDQFYRSSAGVKPSIAEIRSHLQDRQALIVLDHIELSGEDLDKLCDAMPNSTIVVASIDQRFRRANQAIEIVGLAPEAGLCLIEQQLKRSLSAIDQASAIQLIEQVSGHPQRLLQLSVCDIAQLKHGNYSTLIVNRLSEPQHQILMLLSALDQVRLSLTQVAAIANLADPLPELQTLVERHLIQVEQSRYRSTSGFRIDNIDTAAWMERVLTYLINWIDQPRSRSRVPEASHSELIEAQDLWIAAIRWCVDQKQWKTVLKLTRSTESEAAIAKQWGLWHQLLRWSLEAAWALEDEAIEAWALHQLGTLAFCQEQVATGYDTLNEALMLRSTLGDETANTHSCSEAIALTQYNIAQIKALIVPASTLQIDQRNRNWIVVMFAIALIAVIVAAIAQIIH